MTMVQLEFLPDSSEVKDDDSEFMSNRPKILSVVSDGTGGDFPVGKEGEERDYTHITCGSTLGLDDRESAGDTMSYDPVESMMEMEDEEEEEKTHITCGSTLGLDDRESERDTMSYEQVGSSLEIDESVSNESVSEADEESTGRGEVDEIEDAMIEMTTVSEEETTGLGEEHSLATTTPCSPSAPPKEFCPPLYPSILPVSTESLINYEDGDAGIRALEELRASMESPTNARERSAGGILLPAQPYLVHGGKGADSCVLEELRASMEAPSDAGGAKAAESLVPDLWPERDEWLRKNMLKVGNAERKIDSVSLPVLWLGSRH